MKARPNPMLMVPEAFDMCFDYYQQIRWLYKKILELEAKIDGGDTDGTVQSVVSD